MEGKAIEGGQRDLAELTSSPDIIRIRVAVLPLLKVPLHVAVKVSSGPGNDLGIIDAAIPVFQVSQICPPRSTNNDTPIRSRNEVVEVPFVESQGVSVGQSRWLTGGGSDYATASSPIWDDLVAILWQKSWGICVRRHYDLSGCDCATRCNDLPTAVGSGRVGY